MSAEPVGDNYSAEPILVKVCEPESGEVLDSAVLEDNYVVICAGRWYVASENHYSNGTVQITIKRGDR